MAISDDDYNRARTLLIRAGSKTAEKSHPKHTKGAGSPDDHGRQMLREARDEFNMMNPVARQDGRAAVVEAANIMGVTEW